MPAIDQMSNDPRLDDGYEDLRDDEHPQEAYQDAPPPKKKSSWMPYIGAGAIALSVGGFMVYKMMAAPASPMPNFQPQAQQSSMPAPMPMEMPAPIGMPAPSPAGGITMPAPVMPAPGDFGAAPMTGSAAAAPIGMPAPSFNGAPELPVQPPFPPEAMPGSGVGGPAVMAQAAGAVPAAITADIDGLKKEVKDMRDRADKIEGQINAMNGTLQDVSKKLGNASQGNTKPASAAPKPARAEAAKAPPRKPAPKTQREEVTLDNFSIYGLRADRVWMRHKGTQHTFDAGIGDSVPGAGKVERIDLQSRTVFFNGGKKLAAQ